MLPHRKCTTDMILKCLRTRLLHWKHAFPIVCLAASISFCNANKNDKDSFNTETEIRFTPSVPALSLNDLDPEILFLIFQYLVADQNLTSLGSLSRVNHKFHHIIDENEELYRLCLPALEQKATALALIRVQLEDNEKQQKFLIPSPFDYLSTFAILNTATEEIDEYDEFPQYAPIILVPQTEKEKFKHLVYVIKNNEIAISQLHFNTYKYYGKMAAFLTLSTFFAIGRMYPMLYIELYRYFFS